MRAHVRKWGNSLALRIPKPLAADLCLHEESVVAVSLVRGTLVVTPVAEPTATLGELLESVTESNRHGEVDFGAPVGREVW